jgi:hypothetical protein
VKDETIEAAICGQIAFRDTQIVAGNRRLVMLAAIRVCESKSVDMTQGEIQGVIDRSGVLGQFFDHFEDRVDFNFQSAFEKCLAAVAMELSSEDDSA